jgi:hypothetical protein
MQRLLPALAMIPLLPACTNPCQGPEQITGVVYEGFATVRVFGASSDDASELEGFPSYFTPANGSHNWEVRWGGANSGPVVLLIDEQEFDGTGSWDLVDCGTFTLDIPEQVYVDERGNTHSFVLGGFFMAFQTRLEGSFRWAEAWESADGTEDGQFIAEDVQLRGSTL